MIVHEPCAGLAEQFGNQLRWPTSAALVVVVAGAVLVLLVLLCCCCCCCCCCHCFHQRFLCWCGGASCNSMSGTRGTPASARAHTHVWITGRLSELLCIGIRRLCCCCCCWLLLAAAAAAATATTGQGIAGRDSIGHVSDMCQGLMLSNVNSRLASSKGLLVG